MQQLNFGTTTLQHLSYLLVLFINATVGHMIDSFEFRAKALRLGIAHAPHCFPVHLPLGFIY